LGSHSCGVIDRSKRGAGAVTRCAPSKGAWNHPPDEKLFYGYLDPMSITAVIEKGMIKLPADLAANLDHYVHAHARS